MRLPRRLGHAEEATLGEHLDELRGRLIVMLGAIALGTVVAFVFHGHVLDWLNRPLPPHFKPVTLGVAEPFTITLTVSLYAGFVLALPVVLWQLWLFFAPAVDPRSERRVLGLAAFAVVLAAGGVAFGYWILLPRAVHFLTNYDNRHFQHLIQARPYYNFIVTVLVGIVLVFQTPLVVLGLVYLGVLSSRTLRRQRRMGYLITAAVALALPGPDPVTTFLELLPMWALFEGSIWLAVLFERRQARAAPASATLGG
jgi:sec-independent protein translocase protein TatC